MKGQVRCRILVIGAHPGRVAKVISMIDEKSRVVEHENDLRVHLEFLGCVAKFDRYEGENGEPIRYLSSVEYYEEGGRGDRTSSLLPFFNSSNTGEDNHDADHSDFTGISGAVVGCGLEGEKDRERISTFLRTLSGLDIPVEVIQPSEPYANMVDELHAYKALSSEEREEADGKNLMGPSKMAKFAVDIAHSIISKKLAPPPHVTSRGDIEAEVYLEALPSPSIDPAMNRYSCRTCRIVLFGENDLQDPSHVVSQHAFSSRKNKSRVENGCQSFFLDRGLDWMGRMEVSEGKILCPKCSTKVGAWIWSGTQCSCGTWVVPAIYIPKSKVDVVPPNLPRLPHGTVVSPFVRPSLQE